jgi:DNA polymerase-2
VGKHPSTGEVESVRRSITPTFYVARRDGVDRLDELEQQLARLPQLSLARGERLLALDREPSPVLEVEVGTPSTLRHLARSVDAYGDHRTFDLYDVDLRLSHQALLEEGLFPFAWVDRRGDRLELADEQWAIDYDPPELASARLAGEVDLPAGRVPRYEDPIDRLVVEADGDERVFDGPEAAALADLDAALDTLDPDVLFTEDGDRFLIRYLHRRASEHGVPLKLGRARDPDAPLRGERSYFTYGNIKYQPRVEVLHGRLHVDTRDSFFHEEAGFWGLVDLSRITSTPVQELARVGAGTAVTAIQIDRAKREDRLVPWTKNLPEDPKTEHTLVKADRGGFIFDRA